MYQIASANSGVHCKLKSHLVLCEHILNLWLGLNFTVIIEKYSKGSCQ